MHCSPPLLAPIVRVPFQVLAKDPYDLKLFIESLKVPEMLPRRHAFVAMSAHPVCVRVH